MTIDQHMFCKDAIQDVRDKLQWLRHRDPEYFQPLIVKLEKVLCVLRERSFVLHICAGNCTDAAVDYGQGVTR
jgi:hypothetical protein